MQAAVALAGPGRAGRAQVCSRGRPCFLDVALFEEISNPVKVYLVLANLGGGARAVWPGTGSFLCI